MLYEFSDPDDGIGEFQSEKGGHTGKAGYIDSIWDHPTGLDRGYSSSGGRRWTLFCPEQEISNVILLIRCLHSNSSFSIAFCCEAKDRLMALPQFGRNSIGHEIV